MALALERRPGELLSLVREGHARAAGELQFVFAVEAREPREQAQVGRDPGERRLRGFRDHREPAGLPVEKVSPSSSGYDHATTGVLDLYRLP